MANCDTDVEFTWGKAKGTSNKGKKYYSSFFYENEEYHLFDNVIVHDKNEDDGHVAKIMKLWEDTTNGTMMTVLRWFLKPHELPSHLQGQGLCEGSKELFLAFGKGKGVSNENKLDCIERKCNVLCTLKDARNKQPSEEDLKAADYFFNRIYNVDLKKLSNLKGIVRVLGEDVLFNKPEWVLKGRSGDQDTGCPAVNPFSSATIHVTPAVQQPVQDGVVAPDLDTRTRDSRGTQGQSKGGSKADNLPLKRPSLASDRDKPIENRAKLQRISKQETVQGISGVPKTSQDALERTPPIAQQHFTRSASAKKSAQELPKAKVEAKTVSETPNTGRALFADPLVQPGFLIPTRARSKQVQHYDNVLPPKPQDANLEESLSHGKVLLIQNVDASFTSKDIRDLMASAVEGCSDAQMLQQSGSLSAPAGEALLVFETEGLADSALQQLEENCLVLSGCRRPIIASKVKLSDPGKIARFPGHFPLDNFKPWKQRQEEVMKKSFETSHFLDPNTVEFEMATEWRNLHEWLHSCWEQHCKMQMEDIDLLSEKYKKPKLTLP